MLPEWEKLDDLTRLLAGVACRNLFLIKASRRPQDGTFGVELWTFWPRPFCPCRKRGADGSVTGPPDAPGRDPGPASSCAVWGIIISEMPSLCHSAISIIPPHRPGRPPPTHRSRSRAPRVVNLTLRFDDCVTIYDRIPSFPFRSAVSDENSNRKRSRRCQTLVMRSSRRLFSPKADYAVLVLSVDVAPSLAAGNWFLLTSSPAGADPATLTLPGGRRVNDRIAEPKTADQKVVVADLMEQNR